MKNTLEYKKIYEEIENIVRSDGDDKLNIETFINKMIGEMKRNTLSYVAKWNNIPEDILIKLKESNENKG